MSYMLVFYDQVEDSEFLLLQQSRHAQARLHNNLGSSQLGIVVYARFRSRPVFQHSTYQPILGSQKKTLPRPAAPS